jgi:hypothetical protein
MMKHNGQGRRAGRTARWAVITAAALAVAMIETDGRGQARCDVERSWLGRGVSDLAVRLAIARSGLQGRGLAADLAARARATAWLPRLSATVHRGLGLSASASTGFGTSGREAETEALSFSIALSFELDRAGWSPLELEAERMEVQRAERRRALEREVIEHLLQLELARLRGDPCGGGALPGEPGPSDPARALSVWRARVALEALCGLSLTELRRRAGP